MAIVTEATFENGVLRPDEPLPLDKHARVRLSISSLDDDYDPLDAVIGICREGPDISPAAATGVRVLATACPFCKVVLSAGRDALAQPAKRIQIRDVSELLAEALKL